jgi:hypothetical protein
MLGKRSKVELPLMAEPVLTKVDFTARYAAGEFGNHTRTWATGEEALASNSPGPFHIRNKVAGGVTYYNIKRWDMPSAWKDAVARQPAELWYCSEMAPSAATVFQGEIMRGVGGLQLTYNMEPLPMREGMAVGQKTAQGLQAKLLMEHYLDPSDWEWVEHLLDEYEGHVVEFSTYSVSCGTLNRRTVIWEVRSY